MGYKNRDCNGNYIDVQFNYSKPEKQTKETSFSKMDFEIDTIKAVVFDYGNTLIEFTREQLDECDAALANVLEGWYGYVDSERLVQIRNGDRIAPYSGDFRENHLPTMTTNLVQSLYGHPPAQELLEKLLEVRFEAFVSTIVAPNYLHTVLRTMMDNFQLGLLSNYPCGHAIRTSIERIGIDHYFQSVVVSADIGHVKPHPLPFAAVIDELELKPCQCLFIGDNWLGDIQGAKRVGMKAGHTVQFETPENFAPQLGDYQPDITINHLSELIDLFEIG